MGVGRKKGKEKGGKIDKEEAMASVTEHLESKSKIAPLP